MAKNTLTNVQFGNMLSGVPVLVSHIYYNMKGLKDRTPRFDSVFKHLRATLKVQGCDYNTMLSPEQQADLKRMAEDAYNGIRQGS